MPKSSSQLEIRFTPKRAEMNWVDPGQNQVGIPYHECFNSISYTGSLSHLHRLLTKWRHSNREQEIKVKLPAEESRAIDPATGWQISPIVAAALCMNPSKMLTPPQAVKVDALKEASPSFVIMRRLAMRFRQRSGQTQSMA